MNCKVISGGCILYYMQIDHSFHMGSHGYREEDINADVTSVFAEHELSFEYGATAHVYRQDEEDSYQQLEDDDGNVDLEDDFLWAVNNPGTYFTLQVVIPDSQEYSKASWSEQGRVQEVLTPLVLDFYQKLASRLGLNN